MTRTIATPGLKRSPCSWVSLTPSRRMTVSWPPRSAGLGGSPSVGSSTRCIGRSRSAPTRARPATGSSEVFPDGQSVPVVIDGSDRPGPRRGLQARVARSVLAVLEAGYTSATVGDNLGASGPISPGGAGGLPPWSSPRQPPGPHRSDNRRSPRTWTRTITASFTDPGNDGMLIVRRRISREQRGDESAEFPVPHTEAPWQFGR